MNLVKQGLKTIFLDWHGTICEDLFWGQLNNSKTKNIFDSIINCIFVKNRYLLGSWMKGELNTQAIIAKINSETGIDKKYLERELAISVRNMKFVHPEIPKIIGLIRNKNIKVVLASDNMDIFQYAINKLRLNLLFDELLLSNKIGYEKKETDKQGNSLFFNRYLKNNCLEHKNCILIDDSKSTIDFMSSSFGMPTVHIKDSHDTIHELLKCLSIVSVF